MSAYSKLEIDSGVRVHSIIGDRGRPCSNPRTDGVVPYSSSHLDQALSEIVVPSRHDVYEHPLAILEVKRLLKLHLVEMELAREFR